MKLVNFITCDDIRQELSGKHTFVGVFEDLTINFSNNESWPAAIKIAFYMTVQREKSEKTFNKFEFKILRDGEEKSSFGGILKFPDLKDTFSIILNFNSMLIGSAGVLSFKLLVYNDSELLASFDPHPLTISSAILNENN